MDKLIIDKAKAMLADNKSANAICITSDGSFFYGTNRTFADSHSQKLKDKSIVVVGDEIFRNDNKKLFFEGSKWSFVTIKTFLCS